MKLNTLLFTLVFSTLFITNIASQCSISDLIAEVSDCGEDGFVTIDFEFNVTDPGADNQFTVQGNGVTYGTFEYGQTFYTIGPVDADCDIIYEIVITDVNDSECAAEYIFDEPFCCASCDDIIVDYVGLNDCTGSGTFFAEILIDLDEGGTFEVLIDGASYGVQEYGEEIYSFGPLLGDCTSERIIEVIDLEMGCITFITLEPVCCPEYCTISDLTVETLECTGDGLFSITLNFDAEYVEEDNFEFWANGEYFDTYAYDELPITILDFPAAPSGSNTFVTVFGIGEDALCANDLVFDPLECGANDCIISDIIVEAHDCNDDGEIYVDIIFEVANPGPSGQFTINGNGTTYGTFNYGDPFYTIGPFVPDCDLDYEFQVSDVDFPDCSQYYELEYDLCCSNQEECVISDLTVETSECDGDEFFIIIDFNYSNNTNPSFDLVINGDLYDYYEFTELPLTITGLSYDEEYFVIEVNENDNLECIAGLDVVNPCYEEAGNCEITTLDFGPNPVCIDNMISTEWLIAGNNLSGVGFDIFINGDFEVFVPQNDIDWYDFDIQNPETQLFTITVCDNDNPDCCIDWELENPCFESNPDECSITNLFAEAYDCNDEGEIYFDLSFEVTNPGADNQFTVVGNGNSYGTFTYGESFYTIGPFEPNCETAAEIIITDVNNNDCSAAYGFDEIFCCDAGNCEITTLDFGPNPVCIDNMISTEWLIAGNNLSGVGFDIFINGEFEVFVPQNDIDWYDFDIQNPETQLFTITVCDNDNPDCCIDWDLENPCFESNPDECSITNLFAEAYDCNDEGEIYFDLSFEVTNPGADNQFTVVGNGNSYGTFTYGESFYTIGPFEPNCETAAEIIITDVSNNDCSAAYGFDEIFCCEAGNCEITTLDFGPNPVCIDNMISTEWLIAGNNLSGVGFDIFINGEFEVFVPQNDIDWYDFDIQNPETQLFTITVCDNDNPDCCIDWDLENPCFESNPDQCSITNLFAEAYDCNDEGEIYFDLSFEVTNPGADNQFTVVGNGNSYGTFTYGESFYTVGPFEPNCETAAEIIITDVNNNDCSAAYGFDEIFCCEDGNDNCNLSELVLDPTDCEEGAFDLFVNFEFENNPTETFDLWINGEVYGTYLYADLPLTLGSLNFDSAGLFVQVFAGGNDGCTSSSEIANPCNGNGDGNCIISDIVAEFIECDEEDEAYFHITFGYQNVGKDNQFTIVGNGQMYGTFEYGLDFYSIGPVIADCETELEFIIADVNHDGCSAFVTHDPACCESAPECTLEELNIETTECIEDGTFNVILNVETSGNTTTNFDLFVNEEFYGFYEFAELPLTIPDLAYDTELVTFQICENDNPDCCISTQIINPCSENANDFYIENIDIEFVDCFDDMITMSLDFDFGSNDNQFQVSANNIVYGVYNYSDLPVDVEEILGDGVTDYQFDITDIFIENLEAATTVGTLSCDGSIVVGTDDTQNDVELDPSNIKSIKAFDINGRLLGDYPIEKINDIIGFDRSVSSGIIILRIDYGSKIIMKKIVNVN